MQYSQQGVRDSEWRATLRIIWALAKKELLIDYRKREVTLSMSAFGVLIIAITALTSNLSATTIAEVAPAILWTGIAFGLVIGLNRATAQEAEAETLEGLMLGPVGREFIFIGKAVGIFAFFAIAEAVTITAFAVFFNVNPWSIYLLIACALANIGLAALGTLLSAMAASARAREILFPLIFLPASAPVLMACTQITALIINGNPSISTVGPWIVLLGLFDLVFVIASILLFQTAIEE